MLHLLAHLIGPKVRDPQSKASGSPKQGVVGKLIPPFGKLPLFGKASTYGTGFISLPPFPEKVEKVSRGALWGAVGGPVSDPYFINPHKAPARIVSPPSRPAFQGYAYPQEGAPPPLPKGAISPTSALELVGCLEVNVGSSR